MDGEICSMQNIDTSKLNIHEHKTLRTRCRNKKIGTLSKMNITSLIISIVKTGYTATNVFFFIGKGLSRFNSSIFFSLIAERSNAMFDKMIQYDRSSITIIRVFCRLRTCSFQYYVG